MALATLTAWAQTDLKVGTTPGSISPSAVLEAASTTKGFLMPRMTTAQMNAISSPANGLQIYNTTDSCIYIYRNSAWLSTCSPTYAMAWGLLGNSGTTAGTNFVGTTDAQDLVFKRNNTEGLRLSSGKTINTGDLTVSNRLIAGNMGTLDSLSLINAVGTQTSYTNNVHGLRADFTVTPPSGYLYSTFGGYNKLTIKGTNGGNYHVGSLGYISNENTGTVPVVAGAGGTIFHNSVGTIAGTYGLQSSIYNNSTGTITNAYGTYTQIYNLSTGTITNAYGNYITPFVKSGGTMTNAYGLYIDNQTAATNNYGIYVNGASTRALHINSGTSYFGGNVGINTTSPTYKLDINAQTGGTGNPLRLLGLNAGATSDSIISSNSGILRRLSINQILANAWNITGNAGTTAGTNFIGTTDAQSLVFKTNNAEGMRLNTSGYLGIGTTTPSVNLEVVGLGKIQTASTFNLFLNGGNTTNTGTYNTIVGLNAFGNATTAEYSTGFGAGALNQVTTGAYNAAFGNGALGATTTGSSNIAFGGGALLSNTTGTHNGALGIQALAASVSGTHNLAVGNYALSSLASGNSNIGLGWGAGGNITSGSDNIIIGFQINPPSLTGSGQLNIGNLLYGTSLGTGSTRSTGNIGINTTTPQYKLDIDAQTGSSGNPLRLLGLNAGATSDSIISSNSGVLRRLSINQILGNAWNITGNAGTTAGTNFIGTTDNQGLVVKTNNSTALTVPVNPMGGLINFASNRSGAVYPSYAGYYNWTLPGNIDTSFSLIGGIGYNDLFAIYGKVPTSTIATDGELHIASGDDGVEPIIFEQYNQVGTTFTERMRIHSNGNMGIGANAPDYKLQVEEPGGYNGDIGVRLYNTNNAAYLPSLIFQTARGTKSAATTVTSGTVLGAVRYGGYDGTAFSDIYAGEMRGNATENWTTSAHGTSLNFGTIANGTTTLLDRMIINQNGYVGIGTNTPNQQLEITAAMRMPATTTSTTGVIYKGANRFIHDYKPAANDGNNTFIGLNAGNFSMSSGTTYEASYNTGIGSGALTALTTGGFNTAIGVNTMTMNTTGSYNVALGSFALDANLTGLGNTALGHNALSSNTASSNTAVGNAALYLNTSGTSNVAVGESSLNKNTTGNQNTAVGQSSMKENLTGANNTALGLSALQSNTSGNNNVAVGVSALVNNLTGGNNVVVGYTAMSATTSSNNVGLGYGAGLGTTSGGNNTFVGYNTGSTNSTGSNNTFLGYQANVSSGALSNATAIGNGATVNASNKIRLGNASVTLVETYGSFVTISDRRLKTNITNNNIGLDFIKAVRPVNYELKSQKGVVYDGFVAQEIDSIMRKLNIKTFSGLSKPADTEGGYYTVSYATFVVPLVNAVKELDEKSEKLKVNTETLINENARLKAELERIKSENAALKASIDKNTADIEAIKAVLHKQ